MWVGWGRLQALWLGDLRIGSLKCRVFIGFQKALPEERLSTRWRAVVAWQGLRLIA